MIIPAAKGLGLNDVYLLQWRMIQRLKNNRVHFYDLGGIGSVEKPWHVSIQAMDRQQAELRGGIPGRVWWVFHCVSENAKRDFQWIKVFTWENLNAGLGKQ